MPQPVLGPFAQAIYAELAPLAWADADNGWALAHFINGASQAMEDIELIARDSADGPGWSMVVDVNRCPDEWLPWLGQFIGVRIDKNLPPSDQRQQIRDHEGWARGSVPQIKRVIRRYLVGRQRVQVRERGGSAYHYSIATWAEDTLFDLIDFAQFPVMFATYQDVYNAFLHYADIYNSFGGPSSDAVLAAALAQKPGGLTMNYIILVYQDYWIVWDKFYSYGLIYLSYTSYQDLYMDDPEYDLPALGWESLYNDTQLPNYSAIYTGEDTYQMLWEKYQLY